MEDLVQCAGSRAHEYVRIMTEDGFWDLIAEAKKMCGQDMNASAQWLQDRLTALGPQQAQDFHDILHGYQELAHQYGLWSAASIMCGGCTDDGFIDFRAWLIAQGKEVYLAALRDPDSLADVEPYGGCQFEDLTYVGDKALKAATGRSAYDNVDAAAYDALVSKLGKDVVYGEGIGYPYEWNELGEHFPCLCAKYLEPDELKFMSEAQEETWNYSNPNIQKACEGGPPQKNSSQMMMGMEGMQ